MRSDIDHTVQFKAWLEEHRGILVKVERAYAATAADQADLQQELKLQLWISLRNYSGQAKASTWIYRVCLNTAMTWRRGTARREARIEVGADLDRTGDEAASPAQQADDREMLEQLYAAIHALPEADRALILLALDGLAYREIAEITGLKENHVGVALSRARQRLAAQMKGVIDELE
ncbi:MAG: RNA polymerase sigma factor [Verrucomicrobia bacterium]|nr:RNA polymerase sigma factor [Verrucomicrobiota bacterium]